MELIIIISALHLAFTITAILLVRKHTIDESYLETTSNGDFLVSLLFCAFPIVNVVVILIALVTLKSVTEGMYKNLYKKILRIK